MLGFCLYSQKTKGLVHIVIAYILLIIDSYKSRYPTVAVGWMGLMDFGDSRDNFFTPQIPRTLVPFPPLVIARPTDAHERAQFLNLIVSGQQFYDFEFFGLKRMNSCSPVSVVCTT